jgi:ribosomal protein S18 acetylase RimI-like enzyme
VAAHADALAGYLALARAAHPPVSAQRPMQLRQLYVVPSFQGRGVGSQLLLEAHDVLWLGLDEHNTRAIAFYRRHGFVSLGLHPVTAGEHAHLDLLMSRQR